MGNSWKVLVLFLAVTVVGCAAAANRPPLNANPSDIVQDAVNRAKDEWLCGEVNGTMKQVIKPPPRQHWYDPDLPTQYKVAVEGCGRSSLYTVVCPVDAARCYVVVPGEQAPMRIQEIVPGSGIFPEKKPEKK
jgi:hypothetical protein